MLSYHKLQNRPREFLAATGLTPAEFEQLLPAFQAAYDHKYPPDRTLHGQALQRRAGAGAKGKLSSLADKLLFILVYQKTNPLQAMHGLQFHLSQSQTNYAQFPAVCRRSKWSKHVTNVPRLALLAMAGSKAACKISSSRSHAFRCRKFRRN